MKNNNIYEIKQNSVDSQQQSPGYMLTFLRWKNRDLANFPKSLGSGQDVVGPLIVISDALSVSVSYSKTSPNGVMSATLVNGEINYATAIAPGDFVLVNLTTWDKDIYDPNISGGLYEKSRSLKPINKFDSGFKGVFRISKVFRQLVIDQATGVKRYVVSVQAISHSEWISKIYYNKYLINNSTASGGNNLDPLFITELAKGWADYYQSDKPPCVQDIIKWLITALLGNGLNVNGQNSSIGGVPKKWNRHFLLPSKLGSLLGHPSAKYAADIYSVNIGIEKYSGSGKSGLTPSGTSTDGCFNLGNGSSKLQGQGLLQADFWQNVPVWQILSSYSNSVINEMFTTVKYNKDGFIMPNVTIRQKPFTSEQYGSKKFQQSKLNGNQSESHTKFLSLPKWKIPLELLKDYRDYKDDSLRFNFVQVEGRVTTSNVNNAAHLNNQLARGNYDYVKEDIERCGLRPYTVSTNFDYANDMSKAPNWAALISDMVIGQHLKTQGDLVCVGIQEPISVGDNVQIEDMVFHIENVSHQFSMVGDKKTFITRLSFSNGISINSTSQYPAYGEMEFQQAQEYYENAPQNMFPGTSDTQDIASRKNSAGEDDHILKGGSFSPIKTKKK